DQAPPDASDLAWLAFRYVAGELDEAEASAFELRLEHDLSACEAVAEAVELAGAVALLRPDETPGGPRRIRAIRVLVYLAPLAAAAGLLAILSPFGDRSDQPDVADQPSPNLGSPGAARLEDSDA